MRLPSGFVAAVLGVVVVAHAENRPSPATLRADAIIRVVRAQARSVVFLHTIGASDVADAVEGLGSGVVVGSGGLILTNAHVIADAHTVHVRFMDGRDIEATVVGSDPEADLALLRVTDAGGLESVTLGDSDRTEVGAFVVAIGNPFGLHHSVTAGILSAKARTRDDSGLEFLQTDAAVNPGNSGGGLFDLHGRLIGITSGMVAPRGGGNIGLNFAVPVNVVRALLPQLRAGAVHHGWLGISTRRVPPPAGGAADGPLRRAALEITEVVADSPAAEVAVRAGDILLGAALANRSVSADRIPEAAWLATPGTTMRLTYWREGTSLTVVATLRARPSASPL